MKKSEEVVLKDKINSRLKRLEQNRGLLSETKAQKQQIYETVKDFTVSANKTDEAIKKMRSKDSEMNGLRRKISNDIKELDLLGHVF